jgi:hypothetical protein
MSRYPPLTDEELRQLYRSNPTPESRRLLWEIDRQQEVIFDLAQFVSTIDQASVAGEQLVAFSRLLTIIDAEPSIRRRLAMQRQPRSELLQPPAVLGCMMFESFIGPPEKWQVRAAQIGAARHKPRRR